MCAHFRPNASANWISCVTKKNENEQNENNNNIHCSVALFLLLSRFFFYLNEKNARDIQSHHKKINTAEAKILINLCHEKFSMLMLIHRNICSVYVCVWRLWFFCGWNCRSHCYRCCRHRNITHCFAIKRFSNTF